MFQSFGNTALQLLQVFGRFPLKRGLTVRVFLAPYAVVRQSQLIMTTGTIGRQVLILLQRTNCIGKLLLRHQGAT